MRRVALGALLLAASCSEVELVPRGRVAANNDAEPSQPSDAAPAIRSGLERVHSTMIPSDVSGTPHATRLFDYGGRTVILDTNLVVGGPRGAEGWDLSFKSQQESYLRCAVGALSVAKHNIYCASPDSPTIVVFDARDGRRKYPDGEYRPELAAGAFDVSVTDAALYAASVHRGLEKIPIDDDGLPVFGPRRLLIEGDIEALDGDGGRRLVAADARDKKLYLLEDDAVVRTLDLDGPPVRVRLNGDDVEVSLGSRGVIIVDWKSGAIRHRVRPLAVVNATIKRGDLLAVATATGLYLYDLARSEDVPIGFYPAEFGFLDARFEGNELVAIDWRTIHLFRVHRDGHVMQVDAPLGYVLRKGDGVRFAVRNEGDLELGVGSIKVPPLGVGWIDVAPGTENKQIFIDQGPFGVRAVHILRSDDRVSLGAPLGFKEPLINGRANFALPDCALQFSAWKDVRYLNALGVEPRTTVISVIPYEGSVSTWSSIWSLDAKSISSVIEGGDMDAFNTRYGVTLIFGGADVEVTFDTNAASEVVDFSHQYRSVHALPRPTLLR